MSTLARLEREFQAFILEDRREIEARVVGTARVPVATRLAVYSDAYCARLTEALESNYPMLVKLLGNRQFADLAVAYVRAHPSGYFSIRWYGERLAQWLSEQEPYCRRPLLVELAIWEWNMTLAFDAVDAATLLRDALSGLAPEAWADLRLKPHPSLRLLSFSTGAPAVWRALSRDEAPPAQSLESVTLTGPRHDWAIWRPQLQTLFRSLDAVESAALQAVAQGASFGSVCEAIAQKAGEESAATQAAALLARWLEDEMLAE